MHEQASILEDLATKTAFVSNSIDRLESEITLLREYRTSLIAEVVTGKLDVRQAAAGLPEEIEPQDACEPNDEIEEHEPDEEEATDLP